MNTRFFIHNREQLSRSLDGGFLVISAHLLMQRGNDAAFYFEQEANFWYLTGIEEPDWWLIVDGMRNKSWLVSPDVDEAHQIFEGSLSFDDAKKISGVDSVISRSEALTLLREQAKKHSVVYTLGEHPHKEHFNFTENPSQKKMFILLERTFNAVQDCRKELTQLRAIKQPEEIVVMRKAIRLTMEAFTLVKQKLPNLRFEHEVEAEFDYHFKKNGLTHAYDPIVASGKNACTLHYNKNNMILKKQTLLLMDVGAKCGGYAADISRTFSLGVPTKRQVEVHAALERAHRQIIKLIFPEQNVAHYFAEVDRIMKRTLLELNLLKTLDDNETYRRYFPHSVSHGLGIDVHDSLGAPDFFQVGMVLTVEPGIYIPEEGIGIRIEDDILVTTKGNTNLSGSLSTGLV